MARNMFIAVLLTVALASELASCQPDLGSILDNLGVPRSRNSGSLPGINLNDRWDVFPHYNSKYDAAGFRFQYQWRFRRSAKVAYYDEETSRDLFAIFDSNRDMKIDISDWYSEGGKVVSFADLIVAHDIDGDEKISLEEFLQVRILPNLGLDRLIQAKEEEPVNATPAEE